MSEPVVITAARALLLAYYQGFSIDLDALEAAYFLGRRDGIEAERAAKRQPVSVNLYERVR